MVAIVSSPVREIRVADIHASPLNPRKHFEEKKLKDLADNMKAVGQLEATTVRPSKSQPGKFELVNGERRWLAAKLGEIETLISKVAEMTDAEALAIMLISGAEGNVEALTPLEEASGYQSAMRIMNLTLDGVAARFGKSMTYVHDRLALLQLPEEARDALEKRELAPSTALQIARIPGPEKRAEAASAILHSEVHGGVMPKRAAMLFIEKQICRSLHGAPFDTAAKDLVADAGPCTTCRFRAGNNKDAYGDVKNPHTCMNPTCFEAKVGAARARVLAREAKDGKEPLPPEINAQVFRRGEKGVYWKSDYVAFTQPVPRDLLKSEVQKVPTWATLCGDAGVKIYIGIDQEGRAVDVARLGEAMAAVPLVETPMFTDDVARRHGLARPAGRGAVSPTAGSRAEQEQVEQDLREKAERKAKQRLKKSRRWLDDLVTGLESMAAAGKPAWLSYMFWSLMFDRMLVAIGDEDVVFVCELYEIEAQIDAQHDARAVLTDFVAKISKDKCAALVTAMLLAPWLRAEGPDAKFVTEWHDHFITGDRDVSGTGIGQPARTTAAPTISTGESATLAQLVKAYNGGEGMSPQRCASEFQMTLEDVCGALQIDVRKERNVVTQFRQDVEEGFTSVGISTQSGRDRVVKTATASRVPRFADLAWPEDFRRVLSMLSQAGKPPTAEPAPAAE